MSYFSRRDGNAVGDVVSNEIRSDAELAERRRIRLDLRSSCVNGTATKRDGGSPEFEYEHLLRVFGSGRIAIGEHDDRYSK